MGGVAASGRRLRAVIALVIAYAVALQFLLPSYALAIAGPGLTEICGPGHADTGNGPHKSGKIHCAQCGWDSPGGALPQAPATVVRTASVFTTELPASFGVVVPTLVGPRLSQGPPRADC